MVLKCRKLTGNFISLLILAVVISCCPTNLTQENLYLSPVAASENVASIYAALSPVEAIQTGKTEEKQEIITDNSSSVSTRRILSRDSLLLYCLPLSLCLASICFAILYAVTRAASSSLYIIKFIQLSDGMK